MEILMIVYSVVKLVLGKLKILIQSMSITSLVSTTSMWSEFPVVKVMVWRMLNRLKSEGWPQKLLDMFYLDDESLAWAKAMGGGRIDFFRY